MAVLDKEGEEQRGILHHREDLPTPYVNIRSGRKIVMRRPLMTTAKHMFKRQAQLVFNAAAEEFTKTHGFERADRYKAELKRIPVYSHKQVGEALANKRQKVAEKEKASVSVTSVCDGMIGGGATTTPQQRKTPQTTLRPLAFDVDVDSVPNPVLSSPPEGGPGQLFDRSMMEAIEDDTPALAIEDGRASDGAQYEDDLGDCFFLSEGRLIYPTVIA